jgi:hypothetical protein
MAPETWQLEPVTAMSPEQQQRWWASCHVPHEVDAILQDHARSAVILTSPGCGISTALAFLPADMLILEYSPSEWQLTQTDEPINHFSQWMRLLAGYFTDTLRYRQHQIAELDNTSHEFLLWLIGHYLGLRYRRNWLRLLQDFLPNERWQLLADQVERGELNDLWSSTDLRGQIYDSLDLAKRLGYTAIFAVTDISWADWMHTSLPERTRLRASIRSLLERVQFLQTPSFGMKVGLPAEVIPAHEARHLLRSRAQVISYSWQIDEIEGIAGSLIALKDDQARQDFRDQIWQPLLPDLATIWGDAQIGPGAAVAVARTYLSLAGDGQLPATQLEQVRAALYRSEAPLRIDPEHTQRTLWRGARRIVLDEAPFRIFQKLWNARGMLVDNEALINIAGSDGALDKNISRIRQGIEPLAKESLYIRRVRGSGAYLQAEHCIFD